MTAVVGSEETDGVRERIIACCLTLPEATARRGELADAHRLAAPERLAALAGG